MKKQIILVLSFLMTAMLLTGCSTEITAEKINEMTQIAQKIKENPVEYKVPEDYLVTIEDGKQLGRIIIQTKSEFSNMEKLKVSFDITKDEVQLIKIEESYNYIIFCNVISFLLIGLVLGWCFFGSWGVEK